MEKCCDEFHVDKAYEIKCPHCDELQSIFDLQYTRCKEATKLWQKEHDVKVIPDLGILIEWLMQKAGMKK